MVGVAHFEGPSCVLTFLETIQISRVESMLVRFPRVVERLFSPEEAAYCWKHRRFPYQHFAVRFAAKCVIRRAIGGGRLCEIVIDRDDSGMVSVALRGHAAQMCAGRRIFLSLSHEGDLGAAFIAIEAIV